MVYHQGMWKDRVGEGGSMNVKTGVRQRRFSAVSSSFSARFRAVFYPIKIRS